MTMDNLQSEIDRRQLESFYNEGGQQGGTTSLKILQPEKKPDKTVREIIAAFEKRKEIRRDGFRKAERAGFQEEAKD